MSWQIPKTDWSSNPKAIEPDDLNRIEENTRVVREQAAMPILLEVVEAFPLHAAGRVVFHTVNERAYVSTGTTWIDISGAIGDAVAANVLEGKIFSSTSAGVGITGTMPNKPGHVTAQGSSISGTTLRLRPYQGYYPGDAGNSVQLEDSDWIATNIRNGINIFGKTGSVIEGAAVSSIQRGEVTTPNEGPYEVNVTISAVDRSRSLVFFSDRGSVWSGSCPLRIAWLNSDTNLYALVSGGYERGGTLFWQVVEFEGPINVQSGTYFAGNYYGEVTIAIDAVDISKTVLMVVSTDRDYGATIEFVDSTHIKIDVSDEEHVKEGFWYAVEFQ